MMKGHGEEHVTIGSVVSRPEQVSGVEYIAVLTIPPVAPPASIDAKHGQDRRCRPVESDLSLVRRVDLDRNRALLDASNRQARLEMKRAKQRATITVGQSEHDVPKRHTNEFLRASQ